MAKPERILYSFTVMTGFKSVASKYSASKVCSFCTMQYYYSVS